MPIPQRTTYTKRRPRPPNRHCFVLCFFVRCRNENTGYLVFIRRVPGAVGARFELLRPPPSESRQRGRITFFEYHPNQHVLKNLNQLDTDVQHADNVVILAKLPFCCEGAFFAGAD